MADAWLTLQDYPQNPTHGDLLSFFGVPPDPEERLDENISKKRRYWSKAAQTAPLEGRNRANAIVQAIKEAASAIKRGSEASGGGTTSDRRVDPSAQHDPRTLEELWQIIQRLIYRQRFRDAVQCAQVGANKWPDSSEPLVAFAWSVQMGLADGSLEIPEKVVDRAIRAMQHAMAFQTGAREFRILIGLLQSAGRGGEALKESFKAETLISPFPADLLGTRVALQVRVGQIDQAMKTAARAVFRDPADDNIRAECVDALLQFAVDKLLPVASEESAMHYGRVIRVAAWCADGVPDLEDRVRLHRLWATNCNQRVFTGNVAFRSFAAIISGFLLLPLYNHMASKPTWEVLNLGPAVDGRGRKQKNFAFYQVAASGHVQAVHEEIMTRFVWANQSGQWPELSSLIED